MMWLGQALHGVSVSNMGVLVTFSLCGTIV